MRIGFEDSEVVLAPTALHPFWSVERDDCIQAKELDPRHVLKTDGGTIRVATVEWFEGAEQVYNLEVAGDHYYLVSEARVLSHNVVGCTITTRSRTRREAFREAKRQNEIPVSQQPQTVIRRNPNDPASRQAFEDNNLRWDQNEALYEFKKADGTTVYIREDTPVSYPDDGSQGPHFNSGADRDNLTNHHYWGDE